MVVDSMKNPVYKVLPLEKIKLLRYLKFGLNTAVDQDLKVQ